MSDNNSLEDNFSPEEVNRLRTMLSSDKTVKTKSKQKFSIASTPKWLLVLVGIALTVGLAFFYVRVIDPWVAQMNAVSVLNAPDSEKPITIQNDKFLPFKASASLTSTIPQGVNPKQLGLAENGKLTTPSVFIFASSKANDKSHVIDLYMDFYAQRSRDFITINKAALEHLIKSGKVVLKIHPVLTSKPFSIYAPEALAEVAGTAPDKAWGFFTNLLKQSITLNGTETSDELVKFIATSARNNGGVSVDAASIVNGTFLTWLYTTIDDRRLKVGYTPPVIYVDNKELDQSKWTINDPDQMLSFFSSLS